MIPQTSSTGFTVNSACQCGGSFAQFKSEGQTILRCSSCGKHASTRMKQTLEASRANDPQVTKLASPAGVKTEAKSIS